MLTTAPHHLNVFSLFGIIGFTFTTFIIFCPSPPETLDPRGAPVEALLAELVHCICGHYSLDLQSVLSYSFRLGCEIKIFKILQLLYTIILLLDKSQLNVSFYYIVHWMHLRYLHQSLFLK